MGLGPERKDSKTFGTLTHPREAEVDFFEFIWSGFFRKQKY